MRIELPFQRTKCSCPMCQVYCQHAPGRLAPWDLAYLSGGHDLMTWAEQHLRAVIDAPYPKLIPVAKPGGECHWYINGNCAVHTDAPFGCAYFDAHMSNDEVKKRGQLGIQACLADAGRDGPYTKVWRHLVGKGLTAKSADRRAVDGAMAKVVQQMEKK